MEYEHIREKNVNIINQDDDLSFKIQFQSLLFKKKTLTNMTFNQLKLIKFKLIVIQIRQ